MKNYDTVTAGTKKIQNFLYIKRNRIASEKPAFFFRNDDELSTFRLASPLSKVKTPQTEILEKIAKIQKIR